MIKTYNQVPEVYYKESRDFQLLGRVYDVIFNYLKTNINSIYRNQISESSDKTLLDLVASTVGFETKHNYDTNHLESLCSSFATILKNKGSRYSIELVLDCLLNAQGIDQKPAIVVSKDDPYNIEIFIPSRLADTTIIRDVLDYIIPAGMSYTLITSFNLYLDGTNLGTTKVKAGNNEIKEPATIVTTLYDKVGSYDTINYIPKHRDIDDYGNIIEPGTIDNTTVVMIEDDE